MKCYFYGNRFTTGNCNGIISFAIPDYGISFKTIWDAGKTECQYLALLALLRFLDLNHDTFKDEKIEVLSDSSPVVNQIKGIQYTDEELVRFRDAALEYNERSAYSLKWVPLYDNKAFTGINDYPPNPGLSNIRFSMPDDPLNTANG